MVMKNYPPDFKADAVALYESRPVATIRSVAVDLGINPETLRNWVRAAGVNRPRGRPTQEPAQPPAPLEAENAVDDLLRAAGQLHGDAHRLTHPPAVCACPPGPGQGAPGTPDG
ncbi:transposase [Streptomyces sp. NPDC051956]|uniref:transposase n=1 Tax=Streptomyces sp. NPDC051956 TaxID=3365677 RepID=UPI0037D66972